jgi:hypothetical protein
MSFGRTEQRGGPRSFTAQTGEYAPYLYRGSLERGPSISADLCTDLVREVSTKLIFRIKGEIRGPQSARE